jgi:hypothetical protein
MTCPACSSSTADRRVEWPVCRGMRYHRAAESKMERLGERHCSRVPCLVRCEASRQSLRAALVAEIHRSRRCRSCRGSYWFCHVDQGHWAIDWRENKGRKYHRRIVLRSFDLLTAVSFLATISTQSLTRKSEYRDVPATSTETTLHATEPK